MPHSMTAFARSEALNKFGRLSIELRSVNNRYLELGFRLPDTLRELEPVLRERISRSLSRGKLECSLRFHPLQGDSALKVNVEAVRHLVQAADQVQAIIGPGQALNVLEVLQWPGVLSHEQEALNVSEFSPWVADLLASCLSEFLAARAREGQALAAHIQQRLVRMHELVAFAKAAMPAALAMQRTLLEARLGELKQQFDAGRLEAEMVLLAQKADVAEELDRLSTHLNEVSRILTLGEPIGRKLDFMMQELNREANTLSSKALTADITNAAVEMKVLIEQMREQIQNIE